MTTARRLARGARTRTAVLDAAVALATEHGLDGLSLGQLADRLSVSKSGLFAHWRSKEELQLAAIEHAQEQWVARVVAPALKAPRGVRRLFALHESRLAFYGGPDGLPGGCFFANVKFEYTARCGVIRDQLATAHEEWMGLIARLAAEAVTAGELRSDVEPRQLAYEMEAFGVAAVLQSRLLARGGTEAYERARRGVLDRLRSLCTDPTLLPEA
jgi:AcrR family transcriptional regulator